MPLQPFVFWAQSEAEIFLKVAVRDVEEDKMRLSSADGNNFSLSVFGNGAQGQSSEYSLTEQLHGPIVEISHRVTATAVEIVLHKTKAEWWPRLTDTAVRRVWLKIDFDKWRDPEAVSTDEEQEEESVGKQMRRMLYDDDKKEEYEWMGALPSWRSTDVSDYRPMLRRVYLTLYNVMLFLGHLLIVVQLTRGYIAKGNQYLPLVWGQVHVKFYCLILTQSFEAVHSLLGWTKGSPIASVVQTGGRAFVLMVIVGCEPRMQDKPIILYVLLVYATIELFRYPYYALAVNNRSIGLVTWLRYTMWMPLYPLGFLCEATLAIRAIPFYAESGRLSVRLPNKANMSFDFAYFLAAFLLFAFMPAVVFLTGHMRRQRALKLRQGALQSAKKAM